MYTVAASNRVVGFALTTAMAGALLAGCTTMGGRQAAVSPSGKAEAALVRERAAQADKAIAAAEAAVLAAPHSAEARATLGHAYLDAGRFASAATAFNDAVTLGDTSGRTVLSLALAEMGRGQMRNAAELLNAHEDDIPPADLGLALALSGQPDRGVYVLSDAIRGGENTAKTRQNLAYAYALAGRWREARLMAQQDVPADQVGDRMEQWAMLAQPDAWQVRVAGMLQVPANAADAGQPTRLALGKVPAVPAAAPVAMAAAEPAPAPAAPRYSEAISGELPPLVAQAPVAAPALAPAELPPVAAPPPALPPQTFAAAFAPAGTPAVAHDAASFAPPPALRARPAVDLAPARASAATHLVQLGAFSSEAGARRAWGIYTRRYPQLAGHRMVISEAIVGGKHVWRVSAAGYGRADSAAMCGRVKAGGQGCFAYAEGRPLPGAIDRGTRLAMR